MSRIIGVLCVFCLLVAGLVACQPAAPTQTEQTAPAAQQQAPAPKTEGQAAPAQAPASGGIASSQPAQPTSPPIAAKPVVPFASPTFSPIVKVEPTPGAAGKTTTVSTTGGQPASQPAAQAPAAVQGPQAPGVATGKRSEVKVEFQIALSTAEEVDDIRLALARVPGILDVAGNETAISVGYDAGLILPNQLAQRLASMGHPTKPLSQ
ncbi:MAG: hypothetical protein KIT87_14340 [Anaerolineae bacterium]|nr:hypothetical protein [Anaerolineae bacterium]